MITSHNIDAMMTMLSFILWISIGAATGYLAGQRGRDPVIWFMVGILLGLFGLLLLFILPMVKDKGGASGELDDFVKEELPEDLIEIGHPHDSYLIKDWFYLDASHKQQGPIGYSALRDAWNEGLVGANSFVWSEGMVEWQKIEQLPELKDHLSSNLPSF